MPGHMEGPVRPPRAVKSPKESTGLLMSVIRTLTASQNNTERDQEKAKLQKEFKRSDQRLEDLVAAHDDDLSTAMQAFTNISTRVTTSREKITTVKEKLTTCKMLLHCKRDELRKLWLESVEHKHILSMLDEIESLMEVPEKLEGYMSKKHYLHATQLLVSSVSLLEGTLEGVDALKDVKSELIMKKEHMHEVLVEELHKHLYVRSTNDALKRFKRQGSERIRAESSPGTPKKISRIEPIPVIMGLKYGLRANPSQNMLSAFSKETDIVIDKPVVEDTTVPDPEENSSHFINILVECLALLNKVPEAVETIKERSQKELMAIVSRTTQYVLDNTQNLPIMPVPTGNYVSGFLQNPSQAQLLLELFELVFEQFCCVVNAHKCVLANLKRIASSNSQHGELLLYEVPDIWSKVQTVLEILAGQYLDIQNTTTNRQQASPAFSEVTAASDISSFYAKKRNAKPKTFSLFRFDSSSHAISMNTYLQEQKEAMKDKGEMQDMIDVGQQFVCQPSTTNITTIFRPLMKFVGEIEQALALEPGNHCPLHAFLTQCVNVFLGQVSGVVDVMVDNATKSLDTWKPVNDPELLKPLGTTRPLLQSTVNLDKSLQELQELMYAIPQYAEDFLNLICNILKNYKETCQAAYRGVVQPESEDKRIISATWAKDDDISRFLRHLPNWINLQHLKENCELPDVEESPEEIRLRNKQESEILTGNLTGETLIPHHEILSDLNQLRILALLQESLEWFGSRILTFANNLPTHQQQQMLASPQAKITDLSPLNENTVKSLIQLAKEFEDLADTCLLVLHLEVRVHCFYFLLPVAMQSSFSSGIDSQEPDPEVTKLNKDLSNIDEAMTASLQPRKLKYIFEGLGHLVASILINSTVSIKRINENGVKKMCRNIFAIQQNLTSITMSREVALDHARQYFELFYHSPEEILNSILERGPQFQELEYKNALQLLHNSQPGSDAESLKSDLERLQDILDKVAVTV
ncbi:exocyst complex component 4 [Centruroides vittatus]|uniref:exocyst complex component 4 n=1 Tax=Centruroides vittatus TaxID=120091 RepID=UPI0035108110